MNLELLVENVGFGPVNKMIVHLCTHYLQFKTRMSAEADVDLHCMSKSDCRNLQEMLNETRN